MSDIFRCISKKPNSNNRATDSWCGKVVYSYDLPYVDAGHAALSVEQESRTIPCSECCAVLVDLLSKNIEVIQ